MAQANRSAQRIGGKPEKTPAHPVYAGQRGKSETIDIASAEMFELGFRQLGSVPTGKNAKENRYKNGSKTIGGRS